MELCSKKKLMKKVATAGEYLQSSLAKIPGVTEVRGRGLLLGIVLDSNIATSVVSKARARGLLLNAPDKNVIRIAPALIVSENELREFVKIFSKSLDEVQNG